MENTIFPWSRGCEMHWVTGTELPFSWQPWFSSQLWVLCILLWAICDCSQKKKSSCMCVLRGEIGKKREGSEGWSWGPPSARPTPETKLMFATQKPWHHSLDLPVDCTCLFLSPLFFLSYSHKRKEIEQKMAVLNYTFHGTVYCCRLFSCHHFGQVNK